MDRKEAFARLADKGWTGDLVPVIPPNARLIEGSNIPVSALGKVPGAQYSDGTYGGILKWQTLVATDIELRRWQQMSCNIGLICRRVRAIDIDCENREMVSAARQMIEKRLGKTIWRGRPGTPRGALIYRAEWTIGGKITLPWQDGKIEVLGYGNQIVIWGQHPSGTFYEWQDGSPFDTQVEELPLLAESEIALLLDSVAALLHEYGAAASKPRRQGGSIRSTGIKFPLGHPSLVAQDKTQAVRALWAIPNTPELEDGTPNEKLADYDHVIGVIAAFLGAVGGEQPYVDELIKWSQQWPENQPGWIHEKIASFRKDGTGIGAEALFHCARQWGFDEVPEGTFQPIKPPVEEPGEVVDFNKVREQVSELVQGSEKTILPASTHVGNAYTDQQLAIDCWHRFHLSRVLRYDASSRWMMWNGNRWVTDTLENDEAAALVRNVVGTITKALPEGNQWFNLAFRLEAMPRAKHILEIMRKHARVTVWNDDPYLLNTPRGLVNLRTGEWRGALPTDLVRSITPVAPDNNPPETWLRVATEIFDDDTRMLHIWIDWMALMLIGKRLRAAAVILRGSGRNGKSLLLESIVAMLGKIQEGGYAFIAAEPTCFSMDARKKSDTGSLGFMDGARAAMFTEAPNDWQPNESQLKAAIAGEEVEAKFLYHPVFTFRFNAAITQASNVDIEFANAIPALRHRYTLFDLVRVFADDRKLYDAVLADAPRLLGLCIRRCTEILQGAETFWFPETWNKNRAFYAAVANRSAEHFDLRDPIPTLLKRLIERRKSALLTSTEISQRLQMALKVVADRYDEEAPKLEEALAMTERSLNMHIARAMRLEFGIKSMKIGRIGLKGFRGVTWQPNPVLPFADREEE